MTVFSIDDENEAMSPDDGDHESSDEQSHEDGGVDDGDSPDEPDSDDGDEDSGPEVIEASVKGSAPDAPAAASTAPAEAAADGAAEAAKAELDALRATYPWFVVQTYSGFEHRVKLSLEERIRQHNLVEKFGQIIVPQETVEEMVKGQKRTSKKKFFPGYILVQMNLNDDTWHLVKDTPKVAGFVGDSRNPAPLSEAEIATLMGQMEGGAKRPRPKKQFEEGDAVKVVDGPFADFNGTVDEVKPDKGKLRVLISIFGRNTPVELDFGQVEKV